MRQMRSAALVLVFATSLVSLGCMSINKREHDVDRAPVVTTGAGATILYPGRSVAMPPSVHPREVGVPVAPGASSGSGSSTGYPPSQPAPQGYPPQPGTPPQSGAPAPQAQGYPPSGAPGYTPEYAPPQPAPGGGGLTMLGGTSIEEDRHARIDEEPLYFKYLALPFAVVAAPFKYVYEKARGEHEPGPPVPTLDKTAQPPQPSAAPQDYETRQLQEMERQLAQQQPQAATPPQSAAPPSAPPAPPVARSGAPSLADELSMLRQPATPVIAAYAPGSAPAPAPAPSAAPATPAASPPPSPAPARPTPAGVAGASGEVDRNGDGRPDQWIFRANGDVAREVFDEDFDGRPDRTLIYDPTSHEVVAIEEDSDHDGQVDTWTAFQKGQVLRRRIDSNGDGQVDTWESYRDGQLVRIERDTDGDGFRDRISYYEQGRLAREEEDDDGDGRIEMTRYYDASEKLLRVEEDTNGDGQIDVVSHYEGGKLTSREILDPSMLKNTAGQL